MIYLDNAATTYPKPEAVYRAADRAQRNAFNAGRGSYAEARAAAEIISDTRRLLLSLFHAEGDECVLMPSATYAFNEIIGGMDVREGETVYVSPYEHNSVLRPLYQASSRRGFSIKELPLKKGLGIDTDRMRFMFSVEPPAAVFCSAISNVTGYVMPAADVFAEAKKAGCRYTVLDASQAAGLLDINKSATHADIIVFAGHKTLYGVFGTGGFIKNDVPLMPYITGGTGSDSLNMAMPSEGPGRYEPGSPDIASVTALHEALVTVNREEHYRIVKELTGYLVERLNEIYGVRVIGTENDMLGIVSITIDGYSAQDVGRLLEEEGGIAVRTGYHCAGLIHKHLDDAESAGTVRISVGMHNLKEDIDKLISCLESL